MAPQEEIASEEFKAPLKVHRKSDIDDKALEPQIDITPRDWKPQN